MSLLDPDERGLYVDALKPPSGQVFDRAIATTYSLDLDTLLSIPLHLVLHATEGSRDELLRNGVALLDALRQTTERVRVYVQRGRILFPRTQRTLFGLLEPMLREVDLGALDLDRAGVFHPKVWLLRFVDPEGVDDPTYRLLVLSRNVTTDVSWDVALQLEGPLQTRPRRDSPPLLDFLRSLEQLSPEPGDAPPLLTDDVMDELARVAWRAPEGFNSLGFHHLHPDGGSWLPSPSRRLIVVSPFVSGGALDSLADTTEAPYALVSRAEELDRVPAETLDRFERVYTLHEAAETEDGEDLSDGLREAGLHAKLFLAEKDNRTRLYLGSANATDAAIRGRNNVEFMVELHDWNSKHHDITTFLEPDGFGDLLTEYVRGAVEVDEEAEPLEARLEGARTVLQRAELSLVCGRADDGWALDLEALAPLALPHGVEARAWPVSLRDDSARSLDLLDSGTAVALGPVSTAALTTLIAFKVRAIDAPDDRVRFVLNLPARAFPRAERDAALTRQIVQNEQSFLRYLLLLLGQDPDSELAKRRTGSIAFDDGSAGHFHLEDLPILEEMARVFARDPDRLADIETLIRRLTESETGETVVPRQFRELWDVFQQARGANAVQEGGTS